MESVREELKQELSKLGPRGRGRPYPKGLLENLLSYTVARRRQGAKLVEVAAELGMKFHTLSRWLGEKRPAARFERVKVVAAPTPPASCTLIVHGPRGLRIEGLDLASVVELVRRVAE
jgi:transposase